MRDFERRCIAMFILFAASSLPAAAQDFHFQLEAPPFSRQARFNDINDHGLIAGTTQGLDYVLYGFVYDGITYRTFAVPGAQQTIPESITNDGLVIGSYLVQSPYSVRGFWYDLATGDFRDYDVQVPDRSGLPQPGLPHAMSNNGIVVGEAPPILTVFSVGYLDDHGQITQLLDPAAPNRPFRMSDVNDAGHAVGAGTLPGPSYIVSYLYVNGTYLPLLEDFVDPVEQATGINDQGQIVGNLNLGGFLLDGAAFYRIQHPTNPSRTHLSKINNHGVITGYVYNDDYPINYAMLVSREPLHAAVCGKPDYDKATDKAILVWSDCDGTGRYFFRLTAGGSSTLIEAGASITANQSIGGIFPFKLEDDDVVMGANSKAVNTTMHVSGAGQDGLSFRSQGTRVCVDFELPADVPVLVGRNRVLLHGNNVDLAASQPCPAKESAVVEWKDPSPSNDPMMVDGNRISADAPLWATAINSWPISNYLLTDDYEVSFQLDHEPGGDSVIGLGVQEYTRNWRDVDYAFRVGPSVGIYEKGVWRDGWFPVSRGDVLSIKVDTGKLYYRLNGTTIAESSYDGAPDFYVDTSFGTGAYIVTVRPED